MDYDSKAFSFFTENNSINESCENDNCEHKNTNIQNGNIYCIDCGIQLSKEVYTAKEWRYYGNNDSSKSSDPTRVHLRKNDEQDKNIHKDVAGLGFSDKIVTDANLIYTEITNNQIYRGNSRKSIIFACIFHAYKLSGKPQTHENLIKVFNITRKSALKGLKLVNLQAPKNSKIHSVHITPENLLEDLIAKFSGSEEHKKEICELYKSIKNKSSRLNRARPQSVSAGLIYYYICKNNIEITLKEFASKSELSELTITRMSKEISTILNTPQVI